MQNYLEKSKFSDSDVFRLEGIQPHPQGIMATVGKVEGAMNIFEIYWCRDFILECDLDEIKSQCKKSKKSGTAKKGWQVMHGSFAKLGCQSKGTFLTSKIETNIITVGLINIFNCQIRSYQFIL